MFITMTLVLSFKPHGWLKFALLLIMAGGLMGCTSTLKNEAAFNALKDRSKMGHLYYMGTEGEFHYFADTNFMHPTRYYRYPKADYHFQNEFPKTKDRTQWNPLKHSLYTGTKEFKGEPPEPWPSK